MRKLGISLLLFTAITAYAQPDNLGSLELKVTDRYKAQVKDASKILEQPNYQDSINQKINVNYKISSQPLEVRMQPEVLSPARIVQIEVPELYRAFIRGGYGAYNTALAEVYYNSKRSSKESYGFDFRHLSTQTGVSDILYEDNAFSRNHLGGYYNRYFRKYTWSVSGDINLDKYSYYGRPMLDFLPNDDTLNLGEAPYNWYRSFGIQTSLKEASEKELGWLQQMNLGYRYLYDNYNSQEHDLQLNSDWILPAGDRDLFLELNGGYFTNQYDSLFTGADSSRLFNQNFVQFQLKPYIRVEKDEYALDFGVNLYFVGSDDSRPVESNSGAYFFPELILRYRAVPEVLSVVGGITGLLERNNYRQLSQMSPFITPSQTTVPSRTIKAFVAMEGILSSNTSFYIEGGYSNLRSDAFLYRDPNFYLDSVTYGLDVRYQDLSSFYAKGSISYNWEEKLLLSASAIARDFALAEGELAWYRPFFEASLEGSYTYREKVGLGLNLDYVGARHAFHQDENPNFEGMLKPYVDLGLKIDYYYNSRIGAFINLSNLLNSDYDIFLGYRAQGINAMFGFTYRL